jgi:hypothetical protein
MKIDNIIVENFNGEYDDEAGMAQGNLYTIAKAAQGLLDTIDDRDNLPEWTQEKIAKVEGMLVTVWNYLQSQKAQGIDPQQDLNEFAADDGDGGGEDDALRNYARMWWNGDDATQQQIEAVLDRMGWEIGEDEGGYDNGGVFVVRAGDVNGNSYASWAAEDLTEGVAEGSLEEFAPASNPGGGNYLKALASAWYNGTFNTGNLHKGIKSQEDVEKILQRGIHCGDGKVRKYSIGYNANFDGVEIQSDDHYEYSDYDDAGNDIDERTGKPWGPYDVVEFHDRELDESISEMDGDGAGRDGSNRKSHSTYGSRDKHNTSNGPDIHLGPESMLTSKDIQDRALDALKKTLSKPENMAVLKRLKTKEGVAEAGNKPLEKSYFGMGDDSTPRDIKSQMRGASDNFVKSTADKDTGPIHSQVAKMQTKMAQSELRKRADHDRMATGTNEGEGKKPAQPEADYGDDYQDMVSRVKKLAGLGPLKTVYDPAKRVYKNVPTAVQPKKEQR